MKEFSGENGGGPPNMDRRALGLRFISSWVNETLRLAFFAARAVAGVTGADKTSAGRSFFSVFFDRTTISMSLHDFQRLWPLASGAARGVNSLSGDAKLVGTDSGSLSDWHIPMQTTLVHWEKSSDASRPPPDALSRDCNCGGDPSANVDTNV
eukprot:CAMPEP_0167823282 /NCGR_PEP_ID=MMETSP0112_2-20121227/8019_1 /TAXON_ID=91324 /ORGANISM="Lotharella globosa, Strain CCCM811" /LENGTH=152 /DNA_ID=CAMNT_0007724851 /DNA_START=485 /DNA_END=941 /DNA_ORIENTATION=-